MKNLAISIFGLITSAVVVGVLVYVELEWDFAFYTVLHFFLIPTGALVSGMAAASGYYLGAVWLNARPTGNVLFNMALISIGAYFAINYVEYMTLEVDGQPVAELVGFLGYMDVTITNMSMTFSRGNNSTGILGNWGYGIAALQVLGFAAGGVCVYLWLSSKKFCDDCQKYYKKIWADHRFAGGEDPDEFIGGVQRVAESFDAGNVEGARARHAELGVPKHSKDTHLRTTLMLQQCPECERRHVSLETARQNGQNWDDVKELTFASELPGKPMPAFR